MSVAARTEPTEVPTGASAEWWKDIAPLMGDLSEVTKDHIQDVANLKRFLERWTMDPKFQEAFRANPESTIASLGLPLQPSEVIPLIDEQVAIKVARALRDGRVDECPLSVRRYRAFYREKRVHRRSVRRDGEPANPRIAAWRRRQINRCVGELGVAKAEALVHAPAAFELSKGCTVGCWFCGVAAPHYDTSFAYTDDNAALWRATLSTAREVIGPCLKQGFLYWATDPLDNPDYERFLVDFHDVLGRCPQTTTAQGQKDIERTRRLLQLSHSLDSSIDRFSIITLKSLYRIHDGLRPEELLRVECIPQNREAGAQYPKANAGRARRFQAKRSAEMMPDDSASTIACVSGFLFNMGDRSVQLVTPTNASDRWPLGYWVLAEGTFQTPQDLRELLDGMVDEHVRTSLLVTDVIRLRDDLRVDVEGGEIHVSSRWIRTLLRNQPEPEQLAAMLADGKLTAHEVALRREAEAGVALTETMFFLNGLFARGLIHEEPPAPVTAENEEAVALGT